MKVKGTISFLLVLISLVVMIFYAMGIFFHEFEIYLVLGIVVGIVMIIFYLRIYNLILNNYNSWKVSRGLVYSSIFGAIALVFLSFWDYSYEIIESYRTATGVHVINLYYLYAIGIYLVSSSIFFIIDAFFNKKEFSQKWKLFVKSVVFYGILYGISFSLMIVMAIISLFQTPW